MTGPFDDVLWGALAALAWPLMVLLGGAAWRRLRKGVTWKPT